MSQREAELQSELKAANLRIRLLEEKVDALLRNLYSSKSEKLDPNQLTLLEDFPSKKDEAPAVAETEPGAATKKSAKRSKCRRARIPENLPIREEIVDPDPVKADPGQWRQIGEEVSERLDYQPARFWKHRLVRRKYARKDSPYQPPIVAPLPAGLQERCLATPELIAQVVVSKYADHQPLCRQESIYRSRHGVTIPRQTLCRWTELAAGWLEPVYGEMSRQQQGETYLQIDETPIRYLSPGAGKAAQGYFWVTSKPYGDAIYHWHPGRGAACIHKIMEKSFAGTLQCDGYKAYPSFQKQREGPIQLAGCWAHARRKFFESRARDPVACDWLLGQIGQLYGIERSLRETRAGPALRAAIRSSQSASILRRIQKSLFVLKPRYLPQSKMGKAIAYALDQWERLKVFVSNGAVEIDNNLVENAIRPTKLGAKNWLFIGSEGSGKTSAILFTLVESAKRHGLDPYAYIKELLRRLPEATNWHVPKLVPSAFAKARKAEAA